MIQIESIVVEAKTRRLGQRHYVKRNGKKFNWFKPMIWTLLPTQDIGCFHSPHLLDMLTLNTEEEISNGC